MTYSRSAERARLTNPLPSNISRCSRKAFIALSFALLSLAACSRSRRAEKLSAPTAEEAAYLSNIQISGARMTASENFLQHVVTTLHARVTNNGNKTVSYLEVDVALLNYANQIYLRKKEQPIDRNKPALKPGETRDFEVSFDQLPEDWNQGPPQMTPLRVVLAENQ